MSSRLARFVLAVVAACAATVALAGGPLYTYDFAGRVPYAWNLSHWTNGQVDIHTDLGSLGILDNQSARNLMVAAAAQWSSVPTSSFRAAVAGDFSDVGLGDITAANIGDVIGSYNGGGIFVVFDDDGSIMEEFFGLPSTGVLGITNVEYVNIGTPEILEAFMVISGPGIRQEDPSGIGFAGVLTHELGHAINLGHSQANGAVENFATLDAPEPAGCPAHWPGTVAPTQVETMYPISTPLPGATGEYMATVDRIDDMAALSDLYPAEGYPESRGIIQGEVLDSEGRPVTGVNVIARNVADPFNDFSSSITGQYSKGQDGPDGSFKLTGLTPGANYVIYVDNLLNGAFSVPRLAVLPGPEEYWNGLMETDDASLDDRCGWTTIRVQAGAPRTADVVFNHYPGAPTFVQGPDVGTPTDITPDGSIVVGALDTGEIFRWDLATDDFEPLGEGARTGSPSISDDGSRIAASIRDTDGTIKAAIYDDSNGWSPLPTVPGAVACNNTENGPVYHSAWDISGDGSTVVGLSYGQAGCYAGTTRGFKWTALGGTVQLPKIDTFDRANRANAVNYDGSVIVGWDEAASGTRRATQWRSGTASFIKRNNNPVGEALDLTRDGQFVVGAFNFATSGQAWRYRPSTGVELLGMLPGQTGGAMNAISDDHEVITGFSSSLVTGTLTAGIWTSGLGFSSLYDLFSSQGINTAGVAIANGTAMSGDGRTIVGIMQSRFGFVPWALKIPTVLTCHAGETTTVSFPQGMNAAIAQGDTLGACQCNTAAPAGVAQVQIEKLCPYELCPGLTRTSWTDVAGAAGYDLVRGGLNALRASGGDFGAALNDCLEDNLTSTSLEDGDIPDPGDGFWYLVTASTCGGHGTYDSDAPSQIASRDAGIAASPYACP